LNSSQIILALSGSFIFFYISLQAFGSLL
jgi:hypothetical protein